MPAGINEHIKRRNDAIKETARWQRSNFTRRLRTVTQRIPQNRISELFPEQVPSLLPQGYHHISLQFDISHDRVLKFVTARVLAEVVCVMCLHPKLPASYFLS